MSDGDGVACGDLDGIFEEDGTPAVDFDGEGLIDRDGVTRGVIVGAFDEDTFTGGELDSGFDGVGVGTADWEIEFDDDGVTFGDNLEGDGVPPAERDGTGS